LAAASTSSTPGEPGSRLSLLGRVFGVFLKPRATFETSLDGRRGYCDRAPLCLALGLSLLFIQKVDLASYLRNQADQNTKFAQLPQDRQDETLHSRVVLARYSLGLNVLVPGLLIGVVACFYGSPSMLLRERDCAMPLLRGGGARADAMGCWSRCFDFARAQPPGMLDTQNLVKTASGHTCLRDRLHGSSHWAARSSYSGFGLLPHCHRLWTANPRKISRAAAFGTVFGLWLVWIVAKVGWTAFFGA